jgi:hypothetical protein
METNMADYFTLTVVQHTIPDADMTPLERLLLSQIFQSKRHGEGWYFFAEQSPADMIWVNRVDLEEALASSPDTDSTTHACVAEQLANADHEAAEIELDFSVTSWEPLFQDIVKRSKTLTHVSVVMAFTCGKMRPDGFGGMAILITRDVILGKSTNDLLEDFFVEAGLDKLEAPDAKASDAVQAAGVKV